MLVKPVAAKGVKTHSHNDSNGTLCCKQGQRLSRSMSEGGLSSSHSGDVGHSAMSIVTSEPLALFAAFLLILSCLVTGECADYYSY